MAAGKDYVLGLKESQPTLHDYVVRAFAALQIPARVETHEKRNGALVTKTLHTLEVHDVAAFDLKGAQEVWRVAQTTQRVGLAPVVEEHHFVSSLPPRRLSPDRQAEGCAAALRHREEPPLDARRRLQRGRPPALPDVG